MPERPDPESLRPRLREAEEELKARLEEACAITEPVSEEMTAELIRLEEALADAAGAAKETVSLRRRLGLRDDASSSLGDTVTETERETDAEIGLREFTDSAGVAWKVWEVIPGQARSATFTPDFVAGWLCFETLDGSASRRLPHHPPDWRYLPPAGLERLLREARTTKRKGAAGGKSDEAEP
jgi:hypothetical protein